MADAITLWNSSILNGSTSAMIAIGSLSDDGFDEIDHDQARSIVVAAYDEAEATRLLFLEGEHYQRGAGWVGPFPRNGDASTIALYDSELKREFTSENVAGEIVWRHVMACIGKEATWGATPRAILEEPGSEATSAEQSLYAVERAALDEAIGRHDELLRVWFDDTRRGVYTDRRGRIKTCSIHTLLQRAAMQKVSTGRATLRIFIAAANRDLSGNLPRAPIEASLQRIHVELCSGQKAAVHIDRTSMQEIGVALWAETSSANITTEKAEICYLDDRARTVLRVVTAEQAGQPSADDATPPLDLMGALLHLEMSGDTILTDSLLSQQRDINRRLTMSGRVSNMSGFPERTLLNAQLDGRMVADSAAPGGERFVAEPPTVGPDTINNFTGMMVPDGEGGKKFVPASYQIHEPQSSATYDSAVEAARARMLHEAHQTHALISGDAMASGVSREHAQHEFIRSLGSTVAELNRAGRWLLPTVLALAITTSNEPAYRPYDALHFMFECDIDAGPLSAAARAEDRAAVKDGQLSLETALARSGVDDTDAETERIRSEQEVNLATVKLKAEILQVLSAVPVLPEAAAGIAGFDAAQAALIASSHEVVTAGDGFAPAPVSTPAEDANAQAA